MNAMALPKVPQLHELLLLTIALCMSIMLVAQPQIEAAEAQGPNHLDFYMYIAVQNNSN
eukprot:c40537_g1_i1 orf=3-176(-)